MVGCRSMEITWKKILCLSLSHMETRKKAKHVITGDDFLGEDPLHMPSNTFLKEHNVRAIELPASNKRKNLEDSESSNADYHWKRTKKDSDPSNQKVIDIDCATGDPQHTGSFVGELEHKSLNDDIRGSQDSKKSVTILSAGDTISKKSSISTMPSVVPKPVALAVFDGGKFLFDHQKDFHQRLWMDLCEKITNTSIDCISSLKDDVFMVLGTMKSLNGFDFFGLEELLGSLFDKAAAFGEAWSRSSEEAAKEALVQQLSEAKDRLDKAKTKEIKEASRVKSTQDDLERTIKELGDLKKQKKLLSSSLKRQQRLFSSAQEEVHMIEAEIIGIGDISPLDDEAIENLNASKTYLEAAKEDLKKFNLFV
ncbi:uncharacterized protein LOC142505454 [Primulina tabacum]|uniref:uncharacterized protein LOC142505454 n=1 Tax=Primulina tabacum TaxID=48773 RepID=UPI003F59375F